MKKVVIIILSVILLLNINSCKTKGEYDYSIKDALKISAYVFDESVEGNVYGESDTVYTFEQLKLNEVRLITPMVHPEMETVNLDIFIEFNDGTFEIISENEDVQLSFDNPLEPYRSKTGASASSKRVYGFELSLPNEGFISANPFDSTHGHLYCYDGIEWLPYQVGKEYYLTVNAYKFDNKEMPVIKARLKLIHLDESKTNPLYGIGLYSIELISYEYSDIYKFMEEIEEDDE